MAYLLDANILISAARLHYGLDFCPAFWEWLDAANQRGEVFSIDRVADEVLSGQDAVAEWVDERGERFFRPLTQSSGPVLATLAEWVATHPRYSAAAKTDFLQVADFYLIAAAKAGGHTVVTHEVPAPNAIKRIKIPDVCLAHQIAYITPYAMLRRERARFILPAPPPVGGLFDEVEG